MPDILTSTPKEHAVAIVGLGPKGLYCLERLIAEIHARPLLRPLTIHVFNRSAHFGTSPIYDPDQPEYILVNLSVGEVDLWTAEDPPIAAGRGPSFVDWYNTTFRPEEPLNGDEYLSRAVVGRYLVAGFARLLDHLPSGVTVACHVGEVVDLRPEEDHYQVEWEDREGHGSNVRADKVLLATGHSRLLPDAEQRHYREFAKRSPNALFIPFVYPVVESLGRIPAGARVAMLGIGLTFIDAVLELTEGRGGRFERSADGALSYRAGGREPQTIFPFSRTGLPMAPKADDLEASVPTLTFFTDAALSELRHRAAGEPLDLDRDLWPLFKREMDLHYYRVTMDAPARAQLESCGDDAQAMERVIERYLAAHPGQERFDYRQALDPVGDRRFDSGAELASFVEKYMEQEIDRARRGCAGCGVKAALSLWYDVRRVLGSVLQYGGLTPESHKRLIEVDYPRWKRVAFGPPTINIEKLLALARAGRLDFAVARAPRVATDEAGGWFELACAEFPGEVARAEVLVDARYPSTDVAQDATPLYRRLRGRGMVRAYVNRSKGNKSSAYSPGAIDMTVGSHFVVDGAGVGNRDLAVIGIPTEGNLVGNLAVTRDAYSAAWAAEVIAQLRQAEAA